MATKVVRCGHFEIILDPPLAEGCACVILNAIYLPSNAPCAIKKLQLDETQIAFKEDFSRRFTNEIAILQELNIQKSPYFPKFYGIGKVEGAPFFAMEKIVGRNLLKTVLDDRIPVGERVRYATESLKAIAELHARGKIHRDIKPANVMVRESGEVILIDFSISKSIGQTLYTRAMGTTLATPEYAPEDQMNDSASAQPWWDVFSWGVTAYHAVVRFLPYSINADEPDIWSEVARRQKEIKPEEIERDMTMVRAPQPFAALVSKALVDRGREFKTARDALAYLGKIAP